MASSPASSTAGATLAVHIYCAIVDNHGDIGVCWRLARQLANDYGRSIRLWVDDWAVAREFLPALPETPGPVAIEGVRISPWPLTEADGDLTGDVLIEGFGCALPEPTLAQLAARAVKPVWIDLEYFSAEAWVPSFHLGSSLDLAVQTRRWFFFPGPQAGAGGLLRERDLIAERDRWEAGDLHAGFMARLGANPSRESLTMVCFAYAGAPYAGWADALAHDWAGPVSVWLCGRYSQAAFGPTERSARPSVTLRDIPFVSQDDFDRLLWCADVAWVRGEDSLARALWSGKPFVWHIYPQAEDAHHAKLAAWLAHYAASFPEPLRKAYVDVHRAWNGIGPGPSIGEAWTALMDHWPEWQAHSRARSADHFQMPDLGSNLMNFVKRPHPA